jgi:hypothetical protein
MSWNHSLSDEDNFRLAESERISEQSSERVRLSIEESSRDIIASNEELYEAGMELSREQAEQQLESDRETRESLEALREAEIESRESAEREAIETRGEIRQMSSDIVYELKINSEKLDVLAWGVFNILKSVNKMEATLENILEKVADTDRAWAFAQYKKALEFRKRGLHKEALDRAFYAVNGLEGVHLGEKEEYDLNFLLGTLYLGKNISNPDRSLVDITKARDSFLLAARYAEYDHKDKAANAHLHAGTSMYLLKTPDVALDHFNKAINLNNNLAEAKFQKAKLLCHIDKTDGVFNKILPELIEFDPMYAVRAAGDVDIKKYKERFEKMLVEVSQNLRKKALQAKEITLFCLEREQKIFKAITAADAFLGNSKEVLIVVQEGDDDIKSGTLFGHWQGYQKYLNALQKHKEGFCLNIKKELEDPYKIDPEIFADFFPVIEKYEPVALLENGKDGDIKKYWEVLNTIVQKVSQLFQTKALEVKKQIQDSLHETEDVFWKLKVIKIPECILEIINDIKKIIIEGDSKIEKSTLLGYWSGYHIYGEAFEIYTTELSQYARQTLTQSSLVSIQMEAHKDVDIKEEKHLESRENTVKHFENFGIAIGVLLLIVYIFSGVVTKSLPFFEGGGSLEARWILSLIVIAVVGCMAIYLCALAGGIIGYVVKILKPKKESHFEAQRKDLTSLLKEDIETLSRHFNTRLKNINIDTETLKLDSGNNFEKHPVRDIVLFLCVSGLVLFLVIWSYSLLGVGQKYSFYFKDQKTSEWALSATVVTVQKYTPNKELKFKACVKKDSCFVFISDKDTSMEGLYTSSSGITSGTWKISSVKEGYFEGIYRQTKPKRDPFATPFYIKAIE